MALCPTKVNLLTALLSKTICRSIGGAIEAARGRFPPIVRLETTNACNARCTICPHRQMKRPIATMDESVYRRLIDECGAAGCREVHLHNFGEPLLDKRLAERVAYAKQQGIGRVKIFCNGSLLTPDRAQRLIEAGLDEIKVSFDGASREEFEQIREPLRFDAVVENVMKAVALRDRMRSTLKIRVACCSTTDKAATMQLLENAVDRFAFGKLHNWADQSARAKIAPQTVFAPVAHVYRVGRRRSGLVLPGL